MTLEQQLKHYITNLFNLPRDEVWHCESIEEIADDILPNQYVRLGPLSNKTLQTIPTTLTHFMKVISILSFSTIRNNS